MRLARGVLGVCILLLTGIFPVADLAVRAQSGVTVQTNEMLRLRAGPGIQFATLARIPAGTTLPATARDTTSQWVRVEYNGQVGWLALRYLSVTGRLDALPVTDDTAAAVQPPPAGPGTAVTPTPPAQLKNGDILALSLYAQSDVVDYYRLSYFSDGLRINGFYAEPRKPGKYPALIFNRGGNRDVGALIGYEFIPFAEAGFVVAASQYRGGGGSEGADNLGGADVNDVLSLIPLLKSRAQVDPSRIVMFGSSRGALMTYIALKRLSQAGQNDIRAAVTTSGLADLFMWAKERSDLDASVYPDLIGATTRSNPAAFRDRSATYWPGLIRAPLLLIHGDADTAVSVNHSRTLYSKLRAAGRVVRLLIIPGGDHGLNAFDYGYPAALAWFGDYVGRAGERYDYDFFRPAIDRASAVVRAVLGR